MDGVRSHSRMLSGVPLMLVATVVLAVGAFLASPAVEASSHREAPGISRDPLADNTDVYAFVSPENSSRVCLISNWIPLQKPESGPNFWGFDDNAIYDIRIDNNGDALEDIVYQFRFKTTIRNGNTFLYNTGAVTSVSNANLNVVQTYSVTRVAGGVSTVMGSDLSVAPANIGTASISSYTPLRNEAIRTLSDTSRVFVGPRAEQFYVDLGGTFDLLMVGPLRTPPAPAKNGTAFTNVMTVALEIPRTSLGAGGSADSIIGVWSTTLRRQVTVLRSTTNVRPRGPFVQVSRLGNPLVNEVVIPLKDKDRFNGSHPRDDAQFATYVTNPELATLINLIFGVNVPGTPRNDLVSVFLTGVAGLNQPTGVRAAEMMRLNMSIAPATTPNRLGVIGGDNAGYPNGRRPADDTVDISLRVVAGVLVSGFNVSPNNTLTDGVDQPDVPFLATFPFLADPHPGR